MDKIRTPDSYFHDLPGYHFEPKYTTIDGLRLHYIDEGSQQAGETVLCLHGEPTWSFLYRRIVSILAAEYRVIAMDFVGFGRSDKLLNQSDYSFTFHLDTLKQFIKKRDLRQITVVVQDWGGLIGLTAVTQMKDRFARLVIMNTFLPTGSETMPEAFIRWREFAQRMGVRLPVSRVIKGGVFDPGVLTPEVLSAYEAPFPDSTYKAGAAAWPLLVPIKPSDPGAAEMAAAREALRKWRKPALVMFSDSDPIMRGGDSFFRRLIPSAKDQPNIVIKQAGHFLQEEKGEEIATAINAFIKRTSSV